MEKVYEVSFKVTIKNVDFIQDYRLLLSIVFIDEKDGFTISNKLCRKLSLKISWPSEKFS